MSLRMPGAAEREYLKAIGLAVVHLWRCGDSCIVGNSRDLERSAREIETRNQCAELIAAWWVSGRDAAGEIVNRTASALPVDLSGIFIDADADLVRRVILENARTIGARPTEHATVLKRAALVAERVREMLNDANRTGRLQWFNRAYRDYRAGVEGGSGTRAISYAAARAKLCTALARRLVLVEPVEFGADLVREVFDT